MLSIAKVISLIRTYAPVASPEVIEQAVTDYLDNHPEIEVADGSITEEKLAADVALILSTLESDVSDVKNAIHVLDTDKYEKPSSGIPASDMTSAVQTSLGKADTAYQKPSSGIPATDIESGVIPTVHNIPSGGTTGKVLKKVSGTDYDVEWGDAPTATDAQVTNAVNTYLGINFTNPSNPPLDRSLESILSAAPADMVGNLVEDDNVQLINSNCYIVNAQLSNMNTGMVQSSHAKCIVIPLPESESNKITIHRGVISQRFNVCCCNKANPDLGDAMLSIYDMNPSGTPIETDTITLQTGTKSIVIYFYLDTADTATPTEIINGLMVQFGEEYTGHRSSIVPKGYSRTVSPEDFGAVGDGVSDDTYAVQMALDLALEKGIRIDFAHDVYAVSGVTITKVGSVNFKGITLKKLLSSTTGSVLAINTSNISPSGTISNLIIDMNGVSPVGLDIIESWRHIFTNITVNNSAPNGIGIVVGSGMTTTPGNIFTNINGYGNTTNPSTFVKLYATDNSFSDIDYQNYSIGFDCHGRFLANNVHGYVTKNIYDGSVFLIARAEVVANNVYPDTQQKMFYFIENNVPRILTNVYAYFSATQEIDFEQYDYPVCFATDQIKNVARTVVTNFSIQGQTCDGKLVTMKSPSTARIIIDTITCSTYYAWHFNLYNGLFSRNGNIGTLDSYDMGKTVFYMEETLTTDINETTEIINFYTEIIRPLKGKFPIYLSSGGYVMCESDGIHIYVDADERLTTGTTMYISIPFVSLPMA